LQLTIQTSTKRKIENMTTPHLRKSIDPSPLRRGFRFGALALILACCALPPASWALLPPPPPDGGYPNENTAEGDFALLNLTTGFDNTAIGSGALYANTTGFGNTAVGAAAFLNNIDGSGNTANGAGALSGNTDGFLNTATGFRAMFSHTGSGNTANGAFALAHNNADNNTATGYQAMESNTSGSFNTANGYAALTTNNTGDYNTATGFNALSQNATGNFNTANGVNALFSNISANHNTATGFEALYSNTGDYNTANGDSALLSNTEGTDNTAIGFQTLFSNTTGTNNIAIGMRAGVNLTTGDNNIDIGNAGVAVESNTIRIGRQGTHMRTFVAGISGSPITGTRVVVNSNGRLGTLASSQRFKDNIKPMDKASESILALAPITFHYKKEIDPEGIPQFGLVAEEVAKVNPDLIVRDEKGEIYTVRYDAVNAMLLNEFLKEHRKVEELEKGMEVLTARFEEQAAQIQKVSAQLEANKSALRVVNNP
jgi:hypothetical protein